MSRANGTPYAPHTDDETAAMLAEIGVDDEEALFDIPEAVAFDGDFGIDARTEREIRDECARVFARNDDLTEFLGRGHYGHYVPSVVDHLADRAEFLTSYTQYQPEVSQGFLQALFEYQSMLVELTGLDVANCSMYDAATALGEAATLADRVRSTSGDTVLVPEQLREGKRAVLENYCDGADLTVEAYPMADGTADVDALAERAGDDVVMLYAESPTVRGCIEERLAAIGDLADETDALFALGSDVVALSVLESPADAGADVVVGEAGSLGLPTAYGMGLGLFACSDEFLRQVPGRLVGASEDANGDRAYTLTLQTREQHIRKERATSNICTNQAWVALRAAIHAATLGPDGLVDLANDSVREAEALAARIDELSGAAAPVHDRHHFREFAVRVDQPAPAVAEDLEAEGFAVHAIGEHLLQVCVTDLNAGKTDGLVAAFEEVL
ncbi:aminomethyl-transferring glycine dehydrogenase subunit GcvPA [Halorubrum distributum]|uniref:Aminomethyl-transferring glycine dehydrogenase subunit GcvPA n=1 Tax=Halorubrum distributum TaxID=29283 RepID=A0A6B1ICR7_9EURY|nr:MULTISPECIES: aminomethyl-transferring glycine dehydrogenase subunit GcvPA [Halorubrum distributum group]MDV7348870.1 aminomethyl-transferring glycine dehydrogenase subunit GcvPA [Halorubrum distributum]MYL15451.1 aminomethyl-transferring glycine dehydrogenase subunit GcvPA [Halorubrum terrestre]MYL66553.1 aminomethyl-transferring glycine dehydrogenase subunit GcvPA [Halorubrum terrestre]